MGSHLKGYYNLIEYAKTQVRSKNHGYYENHHIIPHSFGGSDKSNNLVLLTAKEHYVAHYLLTKFTKNNQQKKAINALRMMNISSKNHNRHSNGLSSRLYEEAKIAYSKNHHMKDRNCSGMNNSNAKIFYIFNENDEMVHRVEGGIEEFIFIHNLPKKLYGSALNDGEKLYQSEPSLRQVNSENRKYKGWYAIRYDLPKARKDYYEKYLKPVRHSLESVTKLIQSYSSVSIFKQMESGAYQWAQSRGLWKELSKSLERKPRSRLFSDDEIIAEALKYKSRKEFKTNANTHYNLAYKYDIMKKITHFKRPRVWNKGSK